MEEKKPEGSEDEIIEAIAVELEVLKSSNLDVRDLPAARSLGEAPSSANTDVSKELLEKNVESIEATSPEDEPDENSDERRRVSGSINRKALEKTNRGVSPRSRRFIRGVLHPSPVNMLTAAFFAIGVRLVSIAGVVLMGFFLFEKVEEVALLALAVVPIFVIGYFITAHKARCRVCGVKEFLPSGSRKHKKTHSFLFFGPVISTALHLLMFKWFYCMFCGTAVRIKK